MSALKQTAKPSSLETFDIDIETKVSKPVEAIPVMIAIEMDAKQTAAKPSKKKDAKPVGKNIIIHYDKLQEILGEDCTFKLSFNKMKTIYPEYYNIFVKGKLDVKTLTKATWKNRKRTINQFQYLEHELSNIDSNEKMMARINAEIQAYDIPFHGLEFDNEIELNDKDDDAFDE